MAPVRSVGPAPQHADHGAEVFKRLVRAGADHGSGARDLFWRRVRPELEHAGVQAEQRDPVREHVVHLTRDPGALGVPDLLDAQLLLRLGTACALALRLAAAAAEHAPGDDHRRAERAGEVIHRRRGALGLDRTRHRQQHDLYPGDQARQLPAPIGGDGIERNASGRPCRRRDHHDRHHSKRDSQWPAPPPPQGKAGHRRADRVDDKHRAVQPVPGAAYDGGEGEHGRQEEKDAVDDPVAPRPRRDRRLIVLSAPVCVPVRIVTFSPPVRIGSRR